MKKKKVVIVSCFDWYDKRIKMIREVFICKGYDVDILTSDYDHINKNKITNKNSNCLYIPTLSYKKNISITRVLSHIKFAKDTYIRLSEIQPDIIYALLPPNSVGKMCSKYKIRNKKVKLMVDIIDMWPESMPLQKMMQTYIYKSWKNIRNKTIEVADYVFTECDLYRERMKKELLKKKGCTLYLCKSQEINSYLRVSTDNIASKAIKLCYLGSINNIIDLNAISRVVYNLKKNGFYVEVNIIGDGESREKLVDIIEKSGGTAIYYGKIFDEKQKETIMNKCHFGLNLMKETVCVGLTTKSIDYFSIGLPIINNLKGDTWKFVEQYNIGINYDVEDDINNIDISRITQMNLNVIKLFNEYFSDNALKKRFSDCIIDI